MHIKSSWSYVNKELLAILSFLVISTLVAIVYLVHTLLSVHNFTTNGSNAVSTAFVLQDLLVNVQDLESSTRGYVATGDAAFLTRYDVAMQKIPADTNIIKENRRLQLSSDQINSLTTLTSQKVDIMQRTRQAYENEGFAVAQTLVQTGQGEDIMRRLRTEVTDISSFGLRDIGPLQQRAESNLRRALYVAAAMAVLVLGTCMAVAWYFKRAILHERALESTKNEFLSLASHQLRTPATNVKQYLGLLMDGYMGDLTDKQRHALAVAYKNNESEISIMNNLLDVAKLDLDRIQLHKKVTNIINLARHVARDHAGHAKDRNQTLKVDGPKQVMASVDVDYIKGVIENLVDNAIKYSKEGTRITIRVYRENDYVCIVVKDQGLGIKKRDYTKLFNKFSRLDNEFSANSQGSGLGLYWVKQIVTLHRGTIEVSSKEGSGSVFTVSLPVR
jgi:signal transduction histidine kinase